VSRTIRRLFTVCLVAIALAFVSAARAAEADEHAQQLRKHFSNAVKAFENDQFEDAAKEFEEVLKLSPNSTEALELRDMANVRFYIEAINRGPAPLRENVLKLLELAAEAEKQRLTDKDRIEKLVQGLSGTYEERARIYLELVQAGRYAVVPLLERLANTKAPDYTDYRVRASVALIRIGDEAVLPLCTALRAKNESLRQDIAFILGQIGDPRAVPYLLRAAKSDPDTTARSVAEIALDKIRRYADVPDVTPQIALFRYARLYYYDDPSVRQSSRFGHAIWNWSDKDQRLVMQVIPDFLFSVSMAANVATEALLADPGFEPVLPLLISIYHKETIVIRTRLEAARADAEKGMLSEDTERMLQARLATAQNILLTLRASGEKNFYRALTLQLHDGNPYIAAAVIADLAQVGQPRLNVYPELAELLAPVQPATIRVEPPQAAAAASKAPAATPVPQALTAAERARINARSVFPQQVEAESRAAAPPRPSTVRTAPPAERETLNYLIATARRKAEERRAAEEAAAAKRAAAGSQVAENNPLIMALGNSDKAVRYGAAAALVQIRPIVEFDAAKNVVQILGQALTEKGFSTVLIVSADAQSANLLAEILRSAGQLPFSASSTESALQAARSLPPKDLVMINADMPDAFAALKKDPLTAVIPTLVFTKDQDTTVAQQMYAGKAAVVSLKALPERITDAATKAILGSRTSSEGLTLAVQYAHTAADALNAIPQYGSIFSAYLSAVKDPLIASLDSDDPQVRTAAMTALGKARVDSLIPRFIDLYQSETLARPERIACIEAVGRMVEGSAQPPAEVVALAENIQAGGDAELRAQAVRWLKAAPIPPAGIEKLIVQQEASQEAVPEQKAPAPEAAPVNPAPKPEVPPANPPAPEAEPVNPPAPAAPAAPEEQPANPPAPEPEPVNPPAPAAPAVPEEQPANPPPPAPES